MTTLLAACAPGHQETTETRHGIGRPTSARFEVVHDFGGYGLTNPVGWESSWSPDGSRLVLRGGQGLIVADLSRAPFAYHHLAGIGSPYSWSADGKWLAFPARSGALAIEINSDARETLSAGAELWPVIWGSDGAIYGWSRSTNQRVRLTLPAKYRAPRDGPRNRVLWNASVLNLFRDGDPPSEMQLPDYPTRPVVTLSRGPFANGRLFLLSPPDNDTMGDALMDSSGNIVARIPVTVPGGEIDWTSISADGRWVVGQFEHSVGEGALVGSDVFLADTTGKWRLKVDTQGNAMFPEFSPKGDLLVVEDPIKGGVRLGRLVIH